MRLSAKPLIYRWVAYGQTEPVDRNSTESVIAFTAHQWPNAPELVAMYSRFISSLRRVASLELEFDAPIPSKKNNRITGGQFEKATRQQLRDLETICKVQWGLRPRVRHAEFVFQLACWGGQDRDGMVTTLFDVMKKGGVIEDDRTSVNNGRYTVDEAEAAAPSRSHAKVLVMWKE